MHSPKVSRDRTVLVHRQRDVHKQTLCSSFAELVWAFFVGFDICCGFFFGWLVDFGLGCFGGWWVLLICCYFFPPGKLKCSFITNLKKCNLSLDFGNHTRNVQYKNISILQRIVQAMGWTEKDIYLILAKVQSTINPVPT